MNKYQNILTFLSLVFFTSFFNISHAQSNDPYHSDSVFTTPGLYIPNATSTPVPKTVIPTQDISSKPVTTAYNCADYRGQYDIDSQAVGTLYLTKETNPLNKNSGKIIGSDNSGCYQSCAPKTDVTNQSCVTIHGAGWTGTYVTRTEFYCTAGGYLKQGTSSNADNCSAPLPPPPPTCANGATNYPTCTFPTCSNGAADYPTCTPTCPASNSELTGQIDIGYDNEIRCEYNLYSYPVINGVCQKTLTGTDNWSSYGGGNCPSTHPSTPSTPPTKLCPYAGDVAGTQCDFVGYQGGDCIEGEYVWGKWVYNNDAACTTTQVESGSASALQGYCPGRTGGSCPPGY